MSKQRKTATDPAPEEEEGEDFLTRSRQGDSSLLDFFEEAKALLAESQPQTHTGYDDPDPEILLESLQQQAARQSIDQIH